MNLRIMGLGVGLGMHALALAQGAEQPGVFAPVQVIAESEAFDQRGIEAEREEIALTPGGVTLIEGELLQERNTTNLADALRYVPGIWTASHAGADSIFISSRGSNLDATDYDRNGVKLLQDGLPVTTADGNNHNRIIDPLAARYAVFARGANGMKYGASTLGGAINFVSPTAYDSPAAELFVNGGSHGQLQGRATFSKVFDDRFDALATVEGFRKDGFREHSEMRRTGLYANAGWRISDDIGSRWYATYVDSEQELPRSLTRAQFRADPEQAGQDAVRGNHQVNVETWRLANKTVWELGDSRRLELGVSYEEQTLYHPIVSSTPFWGGLLINTDHREIGAMVRYEHWVGGHELLFGLSYGAGKVEGGHYGNRDGGRRGDLSTRIDQRAHTLEAFAMDRWHLGERWTLVPALQLVRGSRKLNDTDIASGAVDDTEDDYRSVNPSFGIIYHLRRDIDLFASVSRLYEPPTTSELADDVAGDGSALDAMSGTVVEAGLRGGLPIGRHSDLDWDVSLYYARINDEILSVDDPVAPGISLSTNVDRTVHAGLEAVIGGRFALDAEGGHALAPRLALTLNRFRFDDDAVYGDNKLPAAPDYLLRGELLYRHARGYYVGPTFDVVGARYADFANTYKVGSYRLLGLLAGWSKDDTRVYLEIRNVLDKDYVATHSVRNRAGATDALLNPGEPLSAYLGMQMRF